MISNAVSGAESVPDGNSPKKGKKKFKLKKISVNATANSGPMGALLLVAVLGPRNVTLSNVFSSLKMRLLVTFCLYPAFLP